jgi:hypothetical protein
LLYDKWLPYQKALASYKLEVYLVHLYFVSLYYHL